MLFERTAPLSGTMTSIGNDFEIRLSSGAKLKLAGVVLPEFSKVEKHPDMRLQAAETFRFLQDNLRASSLKISKVQEIDRHGRQIGHIVISRTPSANLVWLQSDLVSAGRARVSFDGPENPCAEELLKLEANARTGKQGLWAIEYYAVRQAWETGRLRQVENTFQLVTGRIAKVAETKRFTYLNFGKDWRFDFTASISASVRKRMTSAGFDTTKLEGKLVRIRGWIGYRNGPMIEITNQHQIELLE